MLQNYFHKEIKSKLNFKFWEWLQQFSAKYYVLQFTPQNIMINIYATVILTSVVCEYAAWSLTLRMFKNQVLTMVLGQEGGRYRRMGKISYIGATLICTCQIFLGGSGRMRWMGDAAHIRGEKYIQTLDKKNEVMMCRW